MSKFSKLFEFLCEKYSVRKDANYMAAIKTMKKNGITKEELDNLMEAWNDLIGGKK